MTSMNMLTNSGIPVQSSGSGAAVIGPSSRRRKAAPWRFRYPRHLAWSAALRIIQRLTHYKRGDGLEFKLSFSVLDLLGDKGRMVKDQVGASAQAVIKAGASQASQVRSQASQVRGEAARAVHAAGQLLERGDKTSEM
jgi:hypothetical protein